MRLVRYKTTMTTEKKFPGLFDAKFTHEIKDTKGECNYTGPKVPKDVWNQVISFFAWTYEKTKSESQVRLYVNPEKNTWAAWAFPQEANTGMTARELDNPEAKKQREEFKTSDGWIYSGTVHHHCSAAAFQSGTDEANERGQDGLHITIGCIDKGQHDMHCRFYLNGSQFDPDMSQFWDIGDLKNATPESLWDTIARYQMCKASKAEFPQQWKDNLTEVKPTYGQGHHFRYDGGTGYVSSGSATVSYPAHGGFDTMSEWQKAKFCYECIVRELASDGYSYEEIVDTLNNMATDNIMENIMTNCKYFHVEFEDLYREWPSKSDYLNEMADNILKSTNQYDFDEDNKPEPADPNDPNRKGKGKSKSKANVVPPNQHQKKEEAPPPTSANQQGGPATAGDDMADMSCLD